MKTSAIAALLNSQSEAVLADNNWTEWEAITDCTADCITQNVGTLIYQRSRLNYLVDDLNNSTIPEIQNKTEICTADSFCPKWSKWENAPTPCSATCGGGTQSQIRKCINGQIGQVGCQGPVQQLVACNEDPCPSWSSWSIDYDGGQTCGPFCKMTKTRSCKSGEKILVEIPAPCPGPARLDTGCSPCGSWSDWSEGECSETCGEGKILAERECLTEEGIFADDCPGQSVKVDACKIVDCPTTVPSNLESPSNSIATTASTPASTPPSTEATANSTAIQSTRPRFVPSTVSLLSPTPPQNIETLLAEGTTQSSPTDLDAPMITADALLTVLDNMLESNPEEIDLEQVVLQAAPGPTDAPKLNSTIKTTRNTSTTSPQTRRPSIETSPTIGKSTTSTMSTTTILATTTEEPLVTNPIIQSLPPASSNIPETTAASDIVFDTTFMSREIQTTDVQEELPDFLQPTDQTSTVSQTVRTRESKSSTGSDARVLWASVLVLMVLLSL